MRISDLKLIALLIVFTLPASGAEKQKPLYQQSIEEIAGHYTLIGDFSTHPAERVVSDEIFWSYNYKIPRPEFPIEMGLDDVEVAVPATKGKGRTVEHINRGRILFLEKKYVEARNVWLAARANYGTNWDQHRRNDYFIALNFMQIANESLKVSKDWEVSDVKGSLDNASTFLSWAFIRKEDHPDPLIDAVTPKNLYNLAAIYWKFGRYAGAYGAAEKGLNFLRRTGRTEYRAEFLRISAEAHIQNRTYLEAVQLLDLAIRYEIDEVIAYEKARKNKTPMSPERAAAYKKSVVQVAATFARIGDIYFDLRNYELADDTYAMAARIAEEANVISPEQLVLRGESLFWLGKFSEAQKILHFALAGRGSDGREITKEFAGWASLRHADAGLAQAKDKKDFESARLAYYKVWHSFGESPQSSVANVRAACLELPEYQGNNVQHARELLEKIRLAGEVPFVLNEVAWSCQVASYTERERTPEMLDRVRKFAAAYPESRFLSNYVEPVRELQANGINPYFELKDYYSAVSFFEKNRKLLYPKIHDDLAIKLFEAYTDVGDYTAASEFWPQFEKSASTDRDVLKMLAVAAVLSDDKKQKTADQWAGIRNKLVKTAREKKWKLYPDANALTLTNRIAATKTSDKHLYWLKNLAAHWSAERPEMLCDFEYPVLSRLVDVESSGGKTVAPRLDQIVGSHLPDLFSKDESCGLSLLELESKVMKKKPQALADRYLARQTWPLTGGFLHLYWIVAEHLHDSGEDASARKLWKVIADKGPAKAPETGFSKARLDPTRTELEKLWD